MNNEVILTAKTVEEAMREAREKYGSPENELSFQILEMPKKGFLGIGAAPAKIKVTISKALPDVDLSDLVSEIRNMKLTTDRDGGEDERPAKPPKQPKPQPQKPQQSAPAKAQPQKPQQSAPAKAQQPKSQQNAPAAKPQPQKPQQPAPAPAKPQQPKPQPAAQPAQPKETPKAPSKPLGEDELPAALRRPAARPAEQKKKKPQPKPHPQDNRGEDEKKRDLLSAVMGIRETPAPAPQPAPAKEAPKPQEPAPEAETVYTETVFAAETEETPKARLTEELFPAAEEKPEPEEPQKPEYVTLAEMECAVSFTQKLLDNMGIGATAVPAEAAEGEEVPEGMTPARITVVGDDTGILIGHHGENLDAIQYLMNLSASRKGGSGKREFVKILLDIGNYREKREETLRALARRMSARAVRYKRNVVLEPMNPYERRIIHSEIHGIPNVSTHSVGSDENRKIVITYEGEDRAPRPPRSGDRRRPRGDRKPSSDEAASAPRSPKPERPERRRPKPPRAKSIDEIRIDISEESGVTFGSLTVDEGVETGEDPIEKIAAENESGEESLREF